MNLTLNQPRLNIRTAHRLIILDNCTELFENPTRDSKDIKRTQNVTDRQADRQTDVRTDNNKTTIFPHLFLFIFGRHN